MDKSDEFNSLICLGFSFDRGGPGFESDRFHIYDVLFINHSGIVLLCFVLSERER